MNHVRKDVRITGHKDVYFFISEIAELNALGHKNTFFKSIFRKSAETYERKTQDPCAIITQLIIINNLSYDNA